ncbi:MAG TPA: hypothetical protein PKH40_06840 [Treponemataceae bacterium]|nr:hypothetical protein [Treponemataceae bacterium]HQL31671.1 hypothetical protein [Treponemataceae bacterium]
MKTEKRFIRLDPVMANLPLLEDFIAGTSFLETTECNKALLISTEIFENIIMHSAGFRFLRVYVDIGISRNDFITLVFRYRTRNFRNIIRADGHTMPHYDHFSKRYRGLGLRMCRNLSSSITYKMGLLKSSIIIIL